MACSLRVAGAAPSVFTRKAALLAAICTVGVAMHRSPLEEGAAAPSAGASVVIDASGAGIVQHDPADPPPGAKGVEGDEAEESTTSARTTTTEGTTTAAFTEAAEVNVTRAPSFWVKKKKMLMRPSYGQQKPDVVNVRMLQLSFYGLDTKKQIFTSTLVLEAQWDDPRVTQLLGGEDSLAMDRHEAEETIWLPNLAITNRDVNGVEDVSYSVLIQNGTVTQVQRMIATMKCNFVARDYPFDTQTLEVVIASESYLARDVILEKLQDFDEAEQARAYDHGELQFVGVSAEVFDDIDGPLHKSRYRLETVAKRNPIDAISIYVEPLVILMIIAWLVFCLPLQPPFVMPRVAISMLAILSMISHRGQAASVLASMEGNTWLGMLMECALGMCFVTGLLNVMVEVYNFGMKMECEEVNREMKYILAVWNLLLFVIFYYHAGRQQLDELILLTRCLMAVGCFVAMLLFLVRYMQMAHANKDELHDRQERPLYSSASDPMRRTAPHLTGGSFAVPGKM